MIITTAKVSPKDEDCPYFIMGEPTLQELRAYTLWHMQDLSLGKGFKVETVLGLWDPFSIVGVEGFLMINHKCLIMHMEE